MKKSIKKISIIMPFYHESEERLKTGIDKLALYFKKKQIPVEVIISQNGTNKKITPPYRFTKVVYDRRRGLGRAIKNALKATSGNYFYLVSLEIPYSLTDLDHILQNYSDYNLVIGSKLHSQSIYTIPYLRKYISRCLSIVASLFLPGFYVKDPNGTLFGTIDVFKKMAKLSPSNDFFFSTEVVYQYIKHHYTVSEVPVTYIKRDTQSSVRLADGAQYIRRLIALGLSERIKNNH